MLVSLFRGCIAMLFDAEDIDEELTWTYWVAAAPFRAWLGHLSAATGIEPLAIAVAASVPTGVVRSLAGHSRQPRRIRAVDALALLVLTPTTLKAQGNALSDARPAHQALADLRSLRPSADELADNLNLGHDMAAGLIDGWLDVCPRVVVWRCVALARAIVFELATPPRRANVGSATYQSHGRPRRELAEFARAA